MRNDIKLTKDSMLYGCKVINYVDDDGIHQTKQSQEFQKKDLNLGSIKKPLNSNIISIFYKFPKTKLKSDVLKLDFSNLFKWKLI